MGKEFERIDAAIRTWVEKQHLFFVSTAPSAGDGRVNCSPKGLDSLRILGPRQLAYGDIGGSGIETVAHLKENGRIVIILCAFEGPPKIFRFYGRGQVVEPQQPDFGELAALFPDLPTLRNVIVIDVTCMRDSCGYGVPQYEFVRERDSLGNWVSSRTEHDLAAYRRQNNATSLDGLPGLDMDEST